MIELSQQEIESKLLEEKGAYAVFLFTPFCGTCKLAERMLGIIEEMHPAIPLFKSNINFLPRLSKEWKITSVPCIAIIENNKLLEKVFAMSSVDDLYKLLRPLAP